MKKLKVCALALIVWVASFSPKQARADLFGGDLVFLAQIVTNTLTQIQKLKSILAKGKENLDLVREINRGINDSLRLVKTTFPDIEPGIYKEWDELRAAVEGLEKIYGEVVDSPLSKVQKDTDITVAEAITLNNSIYNYTKEIDKIGEDIKRYSHDVSPGGAAKLTAQSIGVMINVLNQSLRAQATGLKLQAQSLAVENRNRKQQSKMQVEQSKNIKKSFESVETSFALPRF